MGGVKKGPLGPFFAMDVTRHDCQARYDRIKDILEKVHSSIADIEEDWLLGHSDIQNATEILHGLWNLQTRYVLEKVHMEDKYRKILTGIDDE